VTCHISRAQTGGVKGALGVAEDTSDASIACRQIGPIRFLGEFKDGERVFDEHRSLSSSRFKSCASLIASAMSWSMYPTATGSSRQPKEQHQHSTHHGVEGALISDGS